MNAAQLHLMVVHLPVAGILAAAVLLALSLWRRSELLFQTACGFFLACTLLAGLAYFSGGYAYELLEARGAVDEEAAEEHALIARAAFYGMVLLGVATLAALLQYAQAERPGAALRWGLLAGAVLLAWLLAWTAHLGGRISHPEVRTLDWPLFPAITRNE